MLKKSAKMEKVEVQSKIEARRNTSNLHSTSTSACLLAGAHHWVLA
jgi:hypothetical protein